MTKTTKQSGFTLVELAIVLVIIGLIVGGVLVGQDLIKAATIRSVVTDIEKTNAAATAFQGKYTGLPGDLISTKAVEFGLSAAGDANANGAAGRRDGNGLVEGNAANGTNLAGETAVFWRDLSAANFVSGNYTAIGTAATPGAALTAATVIQYVPKTRLRDNAVLHVFPVGGRNMFYLGGMTTTAAGVVTTQSTVTPAEARGIDEKLDDARPTSGIVESLVGTTAATALAAATVEPGGAAAGATTCSDGVAVPPNYNVIAANADARNCRLQIRTSF